MSHNGIKLSLEGTVTLTPSTKTVGLIDSFYSSTKPVQLIQYSLELAKPGKFEEGETAIPFEFKLEPLITGPLHETYHGVYVNIHYLLKADMDRPLLAKNLSKTTEFIIENIPEKNENVKPYKFTITPESLENVKKTSMKSIPKFKITGQIDSVVCNINRPFTGSLYIENLNTSVRSIELQLVRVETCGCAEGYAKEATEIQNIQIAEGNVPIGSDIPMFMIFPRLFTAPTLAAKTFKIEFEINLVVILGEGYLISENFPIKLFRQETKNLIGSF